MSEKKFVKKLRTFGMSMKVPLTAIIIGAALIPLFLEAGIMLGTFRQSQLDARFIEIQNQCVILSNKMTRSGYMTAEKKNNASLDSQMQTLSDVYNGRIVIVGSNFRVVTDTFNLATGKYYLSEEVIKCFKGENSSHYNKDMQYFAQTIPVYDTADAKAVSGVIVVTASTENILSLTDKVMGKSHLFLVCMVLLISVLGVAAAHLLLRPFKKLQMSFDRVAQGDLDADITEETYRETRLLSQSVQKSLSKLKAVDQSRQEFVSNVSHELKTPITSIRVLADSLMVDKMDKTAEDQMNIEQVNINGELELILKRLRPIAKRGNVELILESIREVTADVDKVKISLAITNLVENAIKYNRDSGMVRVTLDADHKYFYIKVADTGIGIPEDALEHIFERFFRVDKARSREVGGTGLGLAIAKNVIQMHHGIIDVESTVGEGTTFSVRIPLNYVPRQEAKP